MMFGSEPLMLTNSCPFSFNCCTIKCIIGEEVETTTDTFNEFALATIADQKATLNQLLRANERLSQLNLDLAEQLKIALGQKTTVKNTTSSNAMTGNKMKKKDEKFDPNGYCWTHGYRVSWKHNSKNCSNKAMGHKDNATRANTMGGVQLNKAWVPGKDE